MEFITLTNPNKATFTFSLYHAIYCEDGNECKCAKDTVLRNGAGGSFYAEVCNPTSVYLEQNEKKIFHSNVLKIQQVATALKTGLLKQVKAEVTTTKTKKSAE
jgi:hypothetical protein